MGLRRFTTQKAFALSILIYVTAFLMAGCNHLQPDPNPGSIESFYPSAEFYACGMRWHGLGVCSVQAGEDLKTLEASVQGFAKGSMRLDSKGCNISQGVTYAQHQLVPIPFDGPARGSCAVTFTVNPEYDSKDVVETHGFRGVLFVKVLEDGEDWNRLTLRVTGNWVYNWPLFIGGSGNVRVIANGCGISYEQDLPLYGAGFVKVPLHEAVRSSEALCVLDGAVVSPEFETLRFNVFIAQYLPNFLPLGSPSVTYIDGKFNIEADTSVSVIIFDGKYKYDNKWRVKADAGVEHRVTLLTTKGRSAIGRWDPQNKEWLWIQ